MASEKPTATTTTAESEPAAPEASASNRPAPQPGAVPVPPTVPSKSPSPRPDGPQATLEEAFPTIDKAVIRAVLKASKGNVESAFMALLEMSDPNYKEEEPPAPEPEPTPALPPRRSSRQPEDDYEPAHLYSDTSIRGENPMLYATTTPRNQLEADEMLARQLQEHYSQPQRGQRPGPRSGPPAPFRDDRRQHRESEESDREHSFLDDDLPVIKENIKQGFLQTQQTVNRWLGEFKKKLDGIDNDDDVPQGGSQGHRGPHAHGGHGHGHGHGHPTRVGTFGTAPGARSPRGRYSSEQYDADPHLLPDDFQHLEIRDNTQNEPRTPRPAANPNLMSSAPLASGNKPSTGRKVSFRDEEDDDDLYAPPQPPRKTSPGPGSTTAGAPAAAAPAGGSKWEPLRSVEPTPMDRDPFSLGDSDDEKLEETPAPQGKAGKLETGVVGEEKKEDEVKK